VLDSLILDYVAEAAKLESRLAALESNACEARDQVEHMAELETYASQMEVKLHHMPRLMTAIIRTVDLRTKN